MRILKITLVFCIAIMAISCKQGKIKKNENQISVSILPQKYFVERIAGNDFKVNVLIPPGASPATYEPIPSQMKEVAHSVAYFRIGHIPFEHAWLDNLIAGAGKIKVYDLSQEIIMIRGPKVKHGDHYHVGGIDPHIWSSPREAVIMAKNLLDGLVELKPAQKEKYQKNYDLLIADLKKLNKEAEEIFADVHNRSFMIFHPALSYLARDYGLNQIAIEEDGKDPSPAHMQHLIQHAKENEIKAIFVQKQFNRDNAEAIAKEIGGKVIQIDPLNEDWLKEMKKIIEFLDLHTSQEK